MSETPNSMRLFQFNDDESFCYFVVDDEEEAMMIISNLYDLGLLTII